MNAAEAIPWAQTLADELARKFIEVESAHIDRLFDTDDERDAARVSLLATQRDPELRDALTTACLSYLAKVTGVSASATEEGATQADDPDPSPPVADQRALSDLSAQQVVALRMIAEGSSQESTASELGVSQVQLSDILETIVSVLGVGGVREAVIMAARAGTLGIQALNNLSQGGRESRRSGAEMTSLRESLGLTIEELASRLGVESEALERLESGEIGTTDLTSFRVEDINPWNAIGEAIFEPPPKPERDLPPDVTIELEPSPTPQDSEPVGVPTAAEPVLIPEKTRRSTISVEEIKNGLRASDPLSRYNTAKLLADLGFADGDVIETLRGLLDELYPIRRYKAAKLLVDLRQVDTDVIAALEGLLDEVSPIRRYQAAKVLVDLGIRSANVTKTLYELLDPTEDSIRRDQAARVLVRIGETDSEVLVALDELLYDPDPVRRINAAETLVSIGRVSDHIRYILQDIELGSVPASHAQRRRAANLLAQIADGSASM